MCSFDINALKQMNKDGKIEVRRMEWRLRHGVRHPGNQKSDIERSDNLVHGDDLNERAQRYNFGVDTLQETES